MKIFKENQTKIKLLGNLYILKLFNLKINKKNRFEAMYINDILDLILFIFLYFFLSLTFSHKIFRNKHTIKFLLENIFNFINLVYLGIEIFSIRLFNFYLSNVLLLIILYDSNYFLRQSGKYVKRIENN